MEILDDSPDGEGVDTPVKPGTVRVILADSQAIYRVGIRKVFALEDDIRVVAQADSLENLRSAIERFPTDIVLLEGGMLAGTANAIPELLRLAPDVKLIVQAVAADENHTVELYRRGVRGNMAVERSGGGAGQLFRGGTASGVVGDQEKPRARFGRRRGARRWAGIGRVLHSSGSV